MITLTNKDADWICNNLRNEIKEYRASLEELLVENKQRLASAKKLAEANKDTDAFNITEDIERFEEAHKAAENDLMKEMDEKQKVYDKMIELLICGSN